MPILSGDDPVAVERCARILADGGLVAFATETVYGLGARADDDAAVRGIFAAKGRPADHPLLVHVVDADAAHQIAKTIPASAQRLMEAFWPGPVTLVVERRPGVAHAAAAGLATVGLRCPDHPVAQALLRCARRLGVAGVAAPSANRFGRVSPTQAAHVVHEFGPDLPVLDGGDCREGIESAIVDCTRDPPRLLRPGTIERHRLEAALDGTLADRDAASPRMSGSLDSHYAPQAHVRLAPPTQIAAAAVDATERLGPAAVGVYSRARPGMAAAAHFQPMSDNARVVAHELFAVLRRFDAQGVMEIWIEAPPGQAEWDGVRDRLQRAAASR